MSVVFSPTIMELLPVNSAEAMKSSNGSVEKIPEKLSNIIAAIAVTMIMIKGRLNRKALYDPPKTSSNT